MSLAPFSEAPTIYLTLSASMSNSIDTSTIDSYRQGTELTQERYYYQGLIKIHAGEPNHQLPQRAFGENQEEIFPENRDFQEVDVWYPTTFVRQIRTTTAVPDEFRNTVQPAGAIFDGVLEPLAIRPRQLASSSDVRFEPHTFRGNLESGNFGLFENSDSIIQIVKFEDLTHGTPFSFHDGDNVSHKVAINADVIPSIAKTIHAFDDISLQSGHEFSLNEDSQLKNIMLGLTCSSDNYVAQNYLAAGSTGNSWINSPARIESIAFGNLLYRAATLTYPTVTGITPSTATSGPASGGTTVSISGTGFFATGPIIYFGTTLATNVTIVNNTTITCTSPAGIGVVDITVIIGARVFVLSSVFSYAPVISSITPSSGDDWYTQSVTISGIGFVAVPSSITIGGNSATSITRIDNTTLTCNVPTGTTGSKDVVVTMNSLQGTLSSGYTYVLTPWTYTPPVWVRSDLGISQSAGAVTTWGNQGTTSGDTNTNLTDAGTANKRPNYNASDPLFNDLPSVDFVAGTNVLISGIWATSSSAPQTVVIVCSWPTDNNNAIIYLRAGTPLTMYKGGPADARMLLTDTATISAGNMSLGSTVILIMTMNGASSTRMINTTTSTTINLGAGHSHTKWTVGENNVSSGAGSHGAIAEIATFNGVMNLSDRQALMVALGARYGVTIT